MLRQVATAILAAFVLDGQVAVAQPSFDCSKAQSATEQLICTNQGLQWSDRQLARLYKLAQKQASRAGRAALAESQHRFLAARDACPRDTLECIGAIYEKRMRELAALTHVHDGYATFVRETNGFLQIARFGFDGAVRMWTSRDNGNLCEFEGDGLLQTGKGILRFRGIARGKECRIDFVPDDENMNVQVEGCRDHCGHGTYLDGHYTRTP